MDHLSIYENGIVNPYKNKGEPGKSFCCPPFQQGAINILFFAFAISEYFIVNWPRWEEDVLFNTSNYCNCNCGRICSFIYIAHSYNFGGGY